MEKKTMGSFLAALRRANGMTQKELAERLNVSDKSVSRWERDDGAPDLALIPVIAEVFGVTCDELLRGGDSLVGRGLVILNIKLDLVFRAIDGHGRLDGVGVLDAEDLLFAAGTVVAGLRLEDADFDHFGAAGRAACEQAQDHDGGKKQCKNLFHRIFPPSVHERKTSVRELMETL